MPAPKGNKFAEKWTEETVLKMLSEIEKHAKKHTTLWLGSALVKVGLYMEIWDYWKTKFKDNDEVFQPIKKIEAIFQDRLFSKALNGDVNSTVAIFGLKNNHKWTDRQETTIKGDNDAPLVIIDDVR